MSAQPTPCNCEKCRGGRGFVKRFFGLPELDTVYEVEAKEIAGKLDIWLARQWAEDEREKEARRGAG